MKCLVVEDDPLLSKQIQSALFQWGVTNTSIELTCKGGIKALSSEPDLLIVDIVLPDGTGIDIVKEANKKALMPMIIAMSGKATPSQAFELGRLGVSAYLEKPFSLTNLIATIEYALIHAPDIVPHIILSVGKEEYHAILYKVKHHLTKQALALTGNNKTKAAELLSITRQAVQNLSKDITL